MFLYAIRAVETGRYFVHTDGNGTPIWNSTPSRWVMEMPFETRQQLKELEHIVKEICARNQAQTMCEIEPYLQAITSIKTMFPEPLLIPAEFVSYLLEKDPHHDER